MPLLDFFKKKKPGKEKKIEKELKRKEGKEKEKKAEKAEKPKAKKVLGTKKKKAGRAFAVLESPHITEKATNLAEQNKYVFKVFSNSNKIEIKKAIEGLYEVDVIDVKIINVHRRRRRLGRQRGWKKGYKKAIVRIKKGQKIEIMPR